MKRERLLLTVLGAVFVVELGIGIPALWAEYAGDSNGASSVRIVAVAPSHTVLPAERDGELAVRSIASTAPAFPHSDIARDSALRAQATTLPLVPEHSSTSAPEAMQTMNPGQRAVSLAVRKPQQRIVVIDDLPQQGMTQSFAYTGHWEHVRAIEDGRTAGTSSRSFLPGSVAVLTFTGSHVRLFGVCGPSGGRAALTLDGQRTEPLASFFAAKKESHMVVYESPPLNWGQHRLTISIAPDEQSTKARYVNIDGAESD